MPRDRHITWDNFRTNFVRPGDPAAHVVDGSPRCEIFVEAGGESIGLRIATLDPSEFVDLPFEHIRTGLVHADGNLCIQISCEVQSLYEPFYAMLVSVVDLVQCHDYTAADAIQISAQRFFSLLSAHIILSEEKQVGLWCELWVLEKLIRYRGPESVRSWTGPLDESHDFRFDRIELEIKGTRSRKRKHMISREDQLLPSADSQLYLLSIQVTNSVGEGANSLPDRVQTVRDLLAVYTEPLARFNSLLAKVNYDSTHAYLYQDHFKLRSRPTLVPITEEVPRVTMGVLETALGADAITRLSDIKFRLDVTDLGFEEVSEDFQSILRTF